jgi:superfamily II DNA or RNA helicase
MSKPLRERLTPKQEQQIRQENGGKDPITPVDMTSVNNVDNVLFRCTACHRAFHFEHLPPISDTTDDPATARFEEYTFTWKCHDCSSVPGEIGALVAWRPADTGHAADVTKEADKEYLIKWKGHSYHHTSWMPGSWVWGIVNPAMRRAFFRSPKNWQPHMTIEEAIPEDFLRVDIVFQVYYSEEVEERSLESDLERIDKVTRAYVKFKGLPYEEAEWGSPPDPSQTERWNDFKAAYEDWVRRDYVHTPEQSALQKHLAHIRKQNFKTQIVRDAQPETMTGGQLMDYQKDGVNWLYYMWFKQQNAILADEMGLGKTIQVIGFFATLIQYHKCWPFLVVVPNSTCPNWRKEIKSWVPSIRVVTYYGSAFARKLAQEHEMFSQGEPDLRCHVVVTSYETMIDDASRRVLMKIPWAGLVVDEGQRLKNDKSQIYESLSRFKFPFKLLLTGTPLQNNTRELFNLLQFCDPTKDAARLDEEYGILSKENIPELHNMIRPFFLRRTKAQVLTFLPPMVQIIVPVSMSVVQKKLYKSILAKNPQLIKAIFQRNDGVKQADRHNLNNILMQLRKCLCHPFVYSEAIEERTSNAADTHKHLVEASGKLKLLSIMLPKLQQRGHRVLIFSQFLDNLDIVEDFLDGLGLLHRRLDGRMNSLEKQKRIDEYNADNSPYFAFLLSTRSGGVGINLATADTVIIMDPDFNPHQDMQALSRAHRIGQKNKVLVFQLMTRGSIEEKIMQIGKKKMVLDHVLIDRMDAEQDDGRDLDSILRHGAQALFNDDDSGDVQYDSESVDKLLDRSQEEQAKTPDESAPESQFSFARVWANDNQNLEGQLQDSEVEDPAVNNTLWEKILQEREQAAAEEARKRAEALGRGKRKRAAVDYGKDATEVSPVKVRQEADNDVEYKADEAVESESDEPGMDSEMERLAKKSKGNAVPA